MGILATASGSAQRASVTTEAEAGTATVEWVTLGGDMSQTRYSPAKQINAENFGTLKNAWTWNGASFNAVSGRSTPSYIDGKLFTVAGERRYVVAIDPRPAKRCGRSREPKTGRYEYSMRKDYGKGVALREDRRPRRRLHHQPGVLPDRARCRNRRSRSKASASQCRSKASRRRASSTCSRISATPTIPTRASPSRRATSRPRRRRSS